MKKIIFLFLLVSLTIKGFSQADTLLNSFFGYVFEDSVILNWELRAGSTCNGIKILRGTDSLETIQIGEIFGVCGNNSEPTPYKFIDKNPIDNKNNFYSLVLGQNGQSHFIKVEYFKITDQLILFPNPNTNYLNIYFNNKTNAVVEIKIINLIGKVLIENQYSNINKILLDISNLESGQYILEVQVKGKEKLFKKFYKN